MQENIGLFCPDCNCRRLCIRERTNHIFHLLMSGATLGLWLIVWAMVGLNNQARPYNCATCGMQVKSTVPFRGVTKPAEWSGWQAATVVLFLVMVSLLITYLVRR